MTLKQHPTELHSILDGKNRMISPLQTCIETYNENSDSNDYYNIVQTVLSFVDVHEVINHQFVNDCISYEQTPIETINSWLIDYEKFDISIESISIANQCIVFNIGRHKISRLSIPFNPSVGELCTCEYADHTKSGISWNGDVVSTLSNAND
ncbi:hypothetical protein [Photobacterium damselae]|uniref:hypothetical protein n=1 Tax=Photobacterium damselae TaxID=38293 RepID=UPI001F3AC596|nr:hypothetical protein [Photobacterium damselae]UKA04781.1 hypothetical protein IHC89_21300 [Photobacterium damselae subsp. damselae]